MFLVSVELLPLLLLPPGTAVGARGPGQGLALRQAAAAATATAADVVLGHGLTLAARRRLQLLVGQERLGFSQAVFMRGAARRARRCCS